MSMMTSSARRRALRFHGHEPEHRRQHVPTPVSGGQRVAVQADATHAGRLPGAACSQCIHVRAFGEGPCDTARRLDDSEDDVYDQYAK